MWDMAWIADPSAWVGLGTLIVLEVVLGIDNLVFISVLASRLPGAQKRQAFFTGLGLALLIRLALLGAGFSSLLANTQRGMVLLGAGLDKDVGLETKFVRFGCLACLLFAMVVCYIYGGAPTQLILMANVATSIATPVGGLFILLLLWRKDVNEGYKKPTALRICMTISYVFVLIMTASALSGYLPKIAALFG